MSAAATPLPRIFENASCPGVSIKVIALFSPSFINSIFDAPILWVIPPCSLCAIFDLRIVSKRVVLPWSTCPTTATTGG